MSATDATPQLERLLGYLAQDPQNPQLLSDVAHQEYLLGLTEPALKHVEAALASETAPTLAHTLMGLLVSDRSAMEEACPYFAEAIRRGEKDPYILFRYAQALSLTQRFAEAEAPAREAAKNLERAPHASALLTRILHYLGKIDEAIAYAEAEVEAGRATPVMRGMLTTLYIDNEDWEKCAQACEQALKLNPNNAEALAAQGTIALSRMNASEALIDFQRAIAGQPGNGRAHLGEGLSHMLSGDLTQAAQSIENATQRMPQHVGTYHALAWCHIMNKNVDAAEKVLQTAYDLNHNFGETHGGLAMVALMRGQLDSAKKYTQQALRLDQGSVSARFAQALIQQASGRPARAQQLMDQLMTQPVLPNGQSIQQTVATYLARKM